MSRVYASRRFILAVIVVASGTALTWFGKIDGIAWGGAIAAVCTGYYVNRGFGKNGEG